MDTKQLENDFLEMITAQKRVIYKVCYVYANDQEELNDLFQEVVLNLWKGFPSYRGDSKLSTWVYRISMNTCISCSMVDVSSTASISVRGTIQSRIFVSENSSAFWKILTSSPISSSLSALSMLACTR